MGYREDMVRCREYISEHSAEDLTAEKLADVFGYSFFHFCHVFTSCNEMSVGEYLRDVRLSKAAAEIVNGSCRRTGSQIFEKMIDKYVLVSTKVSTNEYEKTADP